MINLDDEDIVIISEEPKQTQTRRDNIQLDVVAPNIAGRNAKEPIVIDDDVTSMKIRNRNRIEIRLDDDGDDENGDVDEDVVVTAAEEGKDDNDDDVVVVTRVTGEGKRSAEVIDLDSDNDDDLKITGEVRSPYCDKPIPEITT